MILSRPVKWMVSAAYQKLLTPQVLDQLVNLKGVTEWRSVRTLPSRRVTYVKPSFPGVPALYIKEYRCTGFMNGIARLLASPAEREYRLALLLGRKGIATFNPVAVGVEREAGLPRRSYLISESIEHATTLKEYVGELCARRICLTLSDRKHFIAGLAQFVKELHRKGVLHRDFHWGNILVVKDEQGLFSFYLMDLHRVKVRYRLSKRDVVRNLASLNTALSQQVKKTDRLRFLKAYGGGNYSWVGYYPYYARLIEQTTKQLLTCLWLRRTKQYLKQSAYCVCFGSGRYKGIINREFYTDKFLCWLGDPDRAFCSSSSTIIKNSRTTSSCCLPLHGEGEKIELYIKRYNYQHFFYALKYLFRNSRARRVWEVAHGLLLRGIPTPTPIAFCEKRIGNVLIGSFYITQYLSGALSLKAVFENKTGCSSEGGVTISGDLLYRCALAVRKMHAQGVYHGDLKASNILVRQREGGVENFYFVDLDSAQIKGCVERKKRVEDLARLNLSLLDIPLVSTTNRLRFLRFYLNARKKGDRQVREYWKEIVAETRAKMERQRSG